MPKRYDMHSHLDFADNCKNVAEEAQGSIVTINSTVEPAAFVSACEKFENFDNVHVALGIHPWWVANARIGEVDVAHFETLLPTTNLIGEIGLDFHKANAESKAHQIDVFGRILEDIANADEPKLVFLHSVKANEVVMDMLENTRAIDDSTFVFHWFQGSHEDFGRALSLGCHFSVGMRMLAQENGALFAKAVPDELVLAETDNPAHEGMPWSAGEWIQEIDNTIKSIADARGISVNEADAMLSENSKKLITRFAKVD